MAKGRQKDIARTTEKVIYLDDIEPVILFGTNNVLLNKIRNIFPQLKIVARGNELKCIGEENEIMLFSERLNDVIDYYRKYHRLDDDVIERMLTDEEHVKKAIEGSFEDVIVYGANGRPIRARTIHQLQLVNDYKTNDLIIADGPAGTGKTYTSIALAVRALKNREVKKIVLTRPAVEAGERLGFLPGDMKEKLDPYMQPLYDALRDMLPNEKLEDYILKGIIQIAPLAFMRGRTLDNAFVILDEAQNTTPSQMKLFLTRLGEGSKLIITGDITQIDLPNKVKSGMIEALHLLKPIDDIGIIEFQGDDVVRHPLVKKIIGAYSKLNYDKN